MNKRTLKKHLKYVVPEVRLALIKEPNKKTNPICGPEDVELFIEPLRHYAEEHFVSFFLNAKNEVIGYNIVSRGTVSQSLVHPREVFKAAILCNAHSILVAHNHPSGSLEPSSDDIETTKNLIAAGRLMGVPLIDHIVVTYTDLLSIREAESFLWN